MTTWNVRGLAHKKIDFGEILKKVRTDFAAIIETKKKLESTKYADDYLMSFSGVDHVVMGSK